MKYKALRFVMKIKNAKEDHFLKSCSLVIDGDSYFRSSYKDSGCKFILGGEFDRYADYLKRKLGVFIESNVICYVVFNGAMKADLETRKQLHQKLINDKMAIVPGDDNYYEPVFTKDVQKQVLEELGINYYVCEHDARETMLDVSKNYKCAVLTNNFEYCLLGMSCITPDSIAYDKNKKGISCKIQTPEGHEAYFCLKKYMKPVFMAVIDEDGLLYRKIPRIIGSGKKNPIGNLIYWMNHQSQTEAIEKLVKMLDSEADRQKFRDTVHELIKLILFTRKNPAVKYFNTSDSDNNEFRKRESIGQIAIPYINLKNNGWFSGSWVICDKNRNDAMLPAIDIIICARSALSDDKKGEVTFIGRNVDKSCVTQIKADAKFSKINDEGFSLEDCFEKFVDTALPGFNWSLLTDVSEDMWLLIITLLYYLSKAGSDFITPAYSILVSYLILGPVSKKVGLIKRSNLTMCHSLALDDPDAENDCTYEDCLKAAHAVIDYFDERKIKKNFDRGVLHSLAEFQHCLQQMNYLNKLGGEKN
ncbi:uncharacterized protein [Choristoneura fumiferana]|uniref:uncharacterized protein n=1 Tax=Choristoneura fumiferana TaxID=7141 RepID=UPI003D153BF8